MVTAKEFKEHARRKAKELNLPDEVVLFAESFYKRYNELADEIQGYKEMDDKLNVIVRELGITLPFLDRETRKYLKQLLSDSRLWKRRLV